jgi:hypothetical protein
VIELDCYNCRCCRQGRCKNEGTQRAVEERAQNGRGVRTTARKASSQKASSPSIGPLVGPLVYHGPLMRKISFRCRVVLSYTMGP